MAAAALRVAVALGLFRRAAGVGEFQDCIACGSNNLNWKDMDHCERFEPLSQIVSSSNFEGRHGHGTSRGGRSPTRCRRRRWRRRR